jgi:FkbM family methyltransferase
MSLDLSDHVQRQIYFFGAYEPVELSLFSSLLEPGCTVVDAGANVGFYSLMLAEAVGKTGRVLAFEPVPRTYAQLRANLALNDLPQVSAVNQALWNATEPLTLSLGREQEHNIGSYSCADLPDAVEQAQCEAVRLDDVVQGAGVARVDAIKVDIEGAERLALEGGRGTIDRDRPYVLLEVCQSTCEGAGYSSQELWSVFAGRGYGAYLIGSTFAESGWVQDFRGIRQRNVLLVPPDRPRDLGRWNERELRMAYV